MDPRENILPNLKITFGVGNHDTIKVDHKRDEKLFVESHQEFKKVETAREGLSKML